MLVLVDGADVFDETHHTTHILKLNDHENLDEGIMLTIGCTGIMDEMETYTFIGTAPYQGSQGSVLCSCLQPP